MANWIGCSVSLKTIKGSYQGEISEATGATLTLRKAFCNGIPVENSTVVLTVQDIQDLKLIEKKLNQPAGRSTITVAKPVAKKAPRSTVETAIAAKNNGIIPPQVVTKSKPIDIIETNSASTASKFVNEPIQSGSASGSFKNGTPSRNRFKMKWKDEACFGSPLEQSINQDFDFEKNLALFDKQAVWEEINAAQKPDVVKHTDAVKKTAKYRHDENVIATVPTVYRQIVVPKQEIAEYVTDDGLVVPSISRVLRTRLYATADKVGLSWERRAELMGRAATEIALQLLGGGHRLNPHNTHQWPKVVLLCGPHKEGAIGVNCARQLASHGVHTAVYVPYTSSIEVQMELTLFKLTKNKLITSVTDLPQMADLIVVAFSSDSTETPQLYPELVAWTNNNRAAVLAIDPPVGGIPGVSTKYSLVPVLPLSHSLDNGKLYLCNLGLPVQIFNEVGIKYRSPFGPKFVIPLHPNDP